VLQLPVEIENRVQFILQVAGSMHEIEEAKEDLQLLFFTVIPAGLLLAGLIAYFITSLAFKPMMKMVRAAEQISAANLDARLELPRAHDEVHQLGTALNEMIGRIDKTIKGQRQFVADASHELRTPLTIIRGELEAAAASIRKPSVKENITTSLSELEHLSKLVSDLLTLAKLDAERVRLEVSSVRLDELVVDCVQAARGVAKNKGVTLRIYVEEALEIPGDHEKLKSVMFNLLDNAIKYSARRGVVSVSLMSNRKAGTSSIIISDKGIGIPEAEQSKVFGRFYRGSQPRSKSDGSGLGLAIAQRFVELHGGRIALKSKPGKGSTFTVELPLTSNRT
jgi:signal transduction histidine kinase